MTRISVPLDKSELEALFGMAEIDCRHPREQLRFVLREEAKRRGFLPADAPGAPLNLSRQSHGGEAVQGVSGASAN